MKRWACVAVLLGLSWGCEGPVVTGASVVQSGPLGALPAESVGLVVVEVASFRDLEPVTRWMQEMAARAGEEGVYHQIEGLFGSGTLSRLERLALAVVPLAKDRMGFTVLAQGAFDEAGMRAALGGQDILTLVDVRGQPDLSVTVLEGGSLAIGARRLLEVVRNNSPRLDSGLAANESLIGLLAGVRPDSQVWGAVDYAPMARIMRHIVERHGPENLPMPKVSAVSTLQAIAFQGTFEEGTVAFDLIGRASGEEGARQLTDTARGLVALGRMAVSGDETRGWFQVLDGIRIDQSGAEVLVHGSIPQSALADLAGQAAPAAPIDPGVESGL